MNHLGRQLGLALIKHAALEETPSASSEHTPGQTSEEQSRYIGDLFDQNEQRDPMTDEVEGMYADKLGLYQEFDLASPTPEGSLNRLPGKRPTVPKDSMDPDSDQAWDEHDAFQSSRFPRVDSIANPGPQV